ncbi:type II secretion system F family protein [Billgrantia desiderata]|uniref:type II secretion system F family protein n=1 Tax=Billgrantia desiderata TaxID=52021 RepID=UPI00089E2593|nr:type II secretion system F family protein [Halomonas desiderata]SEG30543.1 Type II secretion system (T2SS), protein F [Halomonas desiderata]
MNVSFSFGQMISRLLFSPRRRLFTYKCLGRLMANSAKPYDAVVKTLSVLMDGRRETLLNFGRLGKLYRPEILFLKEAKQTLASGEKEKFDEVLSDWLPAQEAMMLQTGVKTGRLDIACEEASNIMLRSRKIRTTIFSGLIGPFLMIQVSIGVMIIMGGMMSSAIAPLMGDARAGGATGLMFSLGGWLRDWLLWLELAIFGAIAGIFWMLPRWTGRLRDRFDLYPPFSLYRILYGGTFIISLTSMQRTGYLPYRALQEMSRSASPWLKQRLEDARKGLARGDALGVSLDNAGHNFPDPFAISYIKVLDEQEGFEDSLEEFGRQWIEDSIETVKAVAKIMNIVGLLVVAAMIFLLARGIMGISQELMQIYQF